MKLTLLAASLILSATALRAQGHDPFGSLRVDSQPRYVAPDGSISEIAKGEEAAPLGALHLIPRPGGFTLSFVMDDSGSCVGPHSVEHNIQGDTLTVTLFTYAPAICPGIFTPREYRLTVTHLKPSGYLLRVYLEGRGGRGGKASGAAPWLLVNVRGLARVSR